MYDENNTDILIIKEILGHKSINSTEIYTHVANKKVKELMLNFNILDLSPSLYPLINKYFWGFLATILFCLDLGGTVNEK